MPNQWIEKLKRFNRDGDVWAVPRRHTEERKMIDRGQKFGYTLLSERHPNLNKQIKEEQARRQEKKMQVAKARAAAMTPSKPKREKKSMKISFEPISKGAAEAAGRMFGK